MTAPVYRPQSVRMVRFGSIVLLSLLLAARSSILNLDLHTICAIVSTLAAASLVAVTRVTTRGLWSSATAYLLVFVLFHFGLAALDGVGQPLPEYSVSYVSSWFNSYGSTREALYVSVVACWVFAAAYSWSIPTRRFGDAAVPPAARSLQEHDDQRATPRDEMELAVAARLGAALVILGTTLILGYVAATLPGLLLGQGGRSAYWDSVEGSTAQLIAAPLITYGAVLLALGRRGSAHKVGIVFLTGFGVWALAVGARTAIMYTLLAMVVVVARRRMMPSGRVALALFTLGLIVVGFVGQARLSGGYSERASLDPRAGLAEMGGSIRPVIEVVEYRRVNGEPVLLGITYVSFIARAAEGVLGLPRPDGLTDPRIAGNEFRGRLDGYQIGYSAVAEAFRNGDLPGVIIVFGVFGAVFGRIDGSRSRSPVGDYTVGVIFFALAFHIRQPSVSLVANIAIGLGLVLVWRFLSSTTRTSAPATRQPVLPRRGGNGSGCESSSSRPEEKAAR